ncbi:uncharacterized protein [Periplaneta americana]|uniref:uncharacterized protein n=1 Tax=Periplaneta americana TaxID=6978 RepID=UPI0037E96721
MSAPAVKPALPTAGAQAPKVGSGAPPATTNNPPPSAAGGPKIIPTTGSPNRPIAPPSANHATVGSMPLSLVQEHKTGSGLMQQPPQIPRTPEKTKEHPMTTAMGVKPTSNGVEGSPNRPTPTSQLPVDTKKLEEGAVATAVMNHSAEIATVAATPPQPQGLQTGQATQHNPVVSGTQPSPMKPQSAPVSAAATNHSTLLSVTNKLEGTAVEVKTSVATSAAQSAEPPPPTVPPAPTTVPPAPASIQQQPQLQQQQPPTPQQQHQPQLPPPPQPQPLPQQQTPPALPQQQTQQQQQQQPPQQQQQPQQAPPPPAAAAAPAVLAQTTAPQQQQQQPQQQPVPPASLPPQQQQQAPVLAPQQEPAPVKPTLSLADKPRTDAVKPEFKVATPPRNSKRKREVKPSAEVAKTPASEQDDRKSKRVRTQTQPYQSPLPEIYITKFKTLMKSPDDKLIVFYKNEFLAVRNQEGSFYICQAMQNIYKSSPRIRIRWLSQEKKDNKPSDVYIPDFYDATDFDCILTNLELKRLDKNKYQLPEEERERTQSILKRALDVEKGVSEKPPVTEEHPDGLDLSLFRDESQLKKRRSLKRTARRKGKENASGTEDDYEGLTGDDESEEEVKKKKPKPNKRLEKPKVSVKEKVKTKEKPVEKRAERSSERGRDRGLASKRRSETIVATTTTTAAAAAVKNAAVKQTVAKQAVARQAVAKAADKKPKVVAKTTKKPEAVAESSIPTRSAKTRSVKVASPPKSSPVTRTKDRERRGATPAKGRKKPGKKA